MSKRVNINTLLGTLVDPSLAHAQPSEPTPPREPVERLRGQTVQITTSDEIYHWDDSPINLTDETDRFSRIVSQFIRDMRSRMGIL